MATPYVISVPSDDDDDSDDIEIVEFRKQTQDLINNPEVQHNSTKKLSDFQCPICFDDVKVATTTSCGHIFCLECISQSISGSHALGQVSGRRGTGLCPLCRKSVSFKESTVLRLKLATITTKPTLPPTPVIATVSMDEILHGDVNGDTEGDNLPPQKRKKLS
jgi:hypothetical protein